MLHLLSARELLKNNFRNLKVTIKARGMIAKKNREGIVDASQKSKW
jgi:hypothetical protein